MNAEEIRSALHSSKWTERESMIEQYDMLREIAAQLAELNQTIRESFGGWKEATEPRIGTLPSEKKATFTITEPPRESTLVRDLAEALENVRERQVEDGFCWCTDRHRSSDVGYHAVYCLRARTVMARYYSEVKP